MEGPRYMIDRREDDESWMVFDSKRFRDPTVYMLMLNDVRESRHAPFANYQLTIARFNASENVEQDFLTFDSELYSLHFYAADEEARLKVVQSVLKVLQDAEIENPFLFAQCFGGFIRHEELPIPKPLGTH
ncbi:hypothetical protein [Burkholderia phage BCSR5]|nr:hypothetical protein [Burkholderia phage BCSR5]